MSTTANSSRDDTGTGPANAPSTQPAMPPPSGEQHPSTAVDRGKRMIADIWKQPLVIGHSGFQNKALADFTLNNFVGCSHGCLFCYVPEVATRKQKHPLAPYGVRDPEMEWGAYQLLRRLELKPFLNSLVDAMGCPAAKLHIGGHRAVFVSSTTDAFAPVFHSRRERQRELSHYRDDTLVQALELIRDRSDLKVRILTRSAYAIRPRFVELFRSFGTRLMFGTSLPSLIDELVRAYEPYASSARARLDMLVKAREAGLHTYVAIAPVYPEMTEEDVAEVMEAVRDAGVMTAYLEPIHLRGKNIERIRRGVEGTGLTPDLDDFGSRESAVLYSMKVLTTAEKIADKVGLADRLHLWPDQDLLESKAARKVIADWPAHEAWLQKWWSRVSEWPGTATKALTPGIEAAA